MVLLCLIDSFKMLNTAAFPFSLWRDSFIFRLSVCLYPRWNILYNVWSTISYAVPGSGALRMATIFCLFLFFPFPSCDHTLDMMVFVCLFICLFFFLLYYFSLLNVNSMHMVYFLIKSNWILIFQNVLWSSVLQDVKVSVYQLSV